MGKQLRQELAMIQSRRYLFELVRGMRAEASEIDLMPEPLEALLT